MFFISRAAAGFLFQSREGFALKYSTFSRNGNGKRVKNKQIEPIESFRDTATILQTMPLFLITLHRCLLTRCLSSQHVCSRRTGTARRAREPALTQSFQFTAQSFTQTFTGVHRHRVLTENKDHTQIRTLPRVDGLTQQENVNSSANWKSWGGGWICLGCSALTTERSQKTPEGYENRRTTLVGKDM